MPKKIIPPIFLLVTAFESFVDIQTVSERKLRSWFEAFATMPVKQGVETNLNVAAKR